MMTRRVLLGLLCCFALSACGKADKRVTKANYEKIKPGMTWDEVSSLLGPGEENVGAEGLGSSAAAVGVVGGLDQASSGTPALRWVRYGTDAVHIMVCFNRSDRVHATDFKKEKGLK
ncbi:MAG: outer membrane protein assembly factor BamE [Gemmataceae bacterium]|nr:outer membrane protein assembly factor BamE [Gemmataceae bacterium]